MSIVEASIAKDATPPSSAVTTKQTAGERLAAKETYPIEMQEACPFTRDMTIAEVERMPVKGELCTASQGIHQRLCPADAGMHRHAARGFGGTEMTPKPIMAALFAALFSTAPAHAAKSSEVYLDKLDKVLGGMRWTAYVAGTLVVWLAIKD